MTLRVGIDLHVVDGKYQGSRTHVLELFSRVIDLSPEMQFFVFLDRPDSLAEFGTSWTRENVTRVRMPHANPLVRYGWQLPRLQRRYDLNILHTQHVMPLFLSCATAVTIHDILFERFPEYFTKTFVWRSRLLMRQAARAASHVFTVSDYSKAEIGAAYNVPLSKMTVIHNGVDTEGFASPADDSAYLQARGLEARKYILTTGRLEPRKNHKALIRAYANLACGEIPLVIVGQRDFGYSELFKLIDTLGLLERVHVLEDVDDIELKALYRQAGMFAYPSFAEGFGMPPLEAMAAGTPVIVSNTTALPEVTGDAALLVDPHDVRSLMNAMMTLLVDPKLKEKLIVNGKQRALRFSWSESASIVRRQYLRMATTGSKVTSAEAP